MKGIIFVVWEKYLNERFGSKFVDAYRENIGEPKDQLPITGRVYPDEMLVKGLHAASRLSFIAEDRLMFEYGRYFMINGLVEYLCGYLLAQAWTAYDLVLLMRDAHAQMRRTISAMHISQVYTALAKLLQVGLVASTVNRPGDTFANRRYWRAPIRD